MLRHRRRKAPLTKGGVLLFTALLYILPHPGRCMQTLRPITLQPDTLGSSDDFISLEEAQEVGRNMSKILDMILVNYSSVRRPAPEDDPSRPTKVLLDLNIRSMGPINEIERSYSMDCYFRQTWNDPRLKYVNTDMGEQKEIAVHIALLERLWKPDTYFLNGKNSYIHTITTDNKLLRINPDGTILYSMRLTIKADCPMELRAYPMDTQYCPLTILSFAHGATEIQYQWKYGNNQSIVLNDDVKLSQYDIISYSHSNQSTTISDMTYSSLHVVFRLQRHMGYFLLQVYVPSILLVAMSWITFWLNREATSDRVSLDMTTAYLFIMLGLWVFFKQAVVGITLILTMTTMNRNNGQDLPQVSYATALELYLQMCFTFLMASLVEFVGVHYFTKHGGGDYHNIEDSDDEGVLTEEDIQRYKEEKKREKERKKRLKKSALAKGINIMSTGARYEEPSCGRKLLSCLQGSHEYRNSMRRQAKRLGVEINSVSRLDKVSRVIFPLSFIILNIIYWSVYYFKIH